MELRAELARVNQQIFDLETAYFGGTGGVDDCVLPLGPFKVVNKKGALPVARSQRLFSLSSATGDGGPWPEAAHAPAALVAALAAGGTAPPRERKDAARADARVGRHKARGGSS